MADSQESKGGLGDLASLSNLANLGGSLGNSKEGLIGGVFGAGKAGMKLLQQGKLLYDINMLKRELNTAHEKLQELALTMNRQGKLAAVPELATMCSTIDALTAALAQREADYHQLQAPPLPAHLQVANGPSLSASPTQPAPLPPVTGSASAPAVSTVPSPTSPLLAGPEAPIVSTPPTLPEPPATLFCPSCGRPVRPNARFCGSCRAQLWD